MNQEYDDFGMEAKMNGKRTGEKEEGPTPLPPVEVEMVPIDAINEFLEIYTKRENAATKRKNYYTALKASGAAEALKLLVNSKTVTVRKEG